MKKNDYESDAEILETTRVRLDNAEMQETIYEIMSGYGYTAENLAKGREIRRLAEEAYSLRKNKELEAKKAHNRLEELEKKIGTAYKRDRKIAKALFEKSPETMARLALNGSIPDNYVGWLEVVTTYYTVSSSDEAIQNSLGVLKVTKEHIEEVKDQIEELNTIRSEYLRKKGESQESTDTKNAAFDKLDEWMRDFKKIAKIALEEHPQLLEALHI